MKKIILFSVILMGWLAACQSPSTTPAALPTYTPAPALVSPTGYRPLQAGDMVEGVGISYQYVLPSLERPAIVIAFGQRLLELVNVKPELADGLVAYAQELAKGPTSIYGFDEADPNQTEPKQLTLIANQPIEIAIIPIAEGPHAWSVTESQEGEVRAAYKLIRRKDGGLRFVDAYDMVALQTFGTLMTLNGGGAGLVYSSRLALLRTILADDAYQRGQDVMATRAPDVSQYDSRILKIDPSKTGLLQDQDWVLVSRPGPSGGLSAP